MLRMAAVSTLITAVLAVAVALAAAETHHIVGGWGPDLDVGAWLAGRVFRVGDKLWFKHSGSEVSIVEVDGPEVFDTCNLTNPIRMFTDRVDLENEGLRYFASGDPESCRIGLKMPVSVSRHPRDDDFDPPLPWHHLPPPPFDPFSPSGGPPPEPLLPPPEHKPPPPFEPFDVPPPFEPPEPFRPPPKSPPPPPFEPFGPPPFEPPPEPVHPPPKSPPPPPFEPSGPPPEPVSPPPPPHHPPKSPPPPPPAPAHHPPPPPAPPHPSPAHVNGPSVVFLLCYVSVMLLAM